MDINIITDIPFQLKLEELREALHIKEGSKYEEKLQEYIDYANEHGDPAAMYKESFIEEKGDKYVQIDGIKIISNSLRVNLDEAHKVYPYVITAGEKLHNWAKTIDDMVENYWADIIQEKVLRQAIEFFNNDLDEHYHPGKTSSVNPGSLKGWQIEGQKELFTLLGNQHDKIGVELTDNYLMVPAKSVSGIRYPSELSFENCQLCKMVNCPDRKVEFNQSLYDEKYSE